MHSLRLLVNCNRASFLYYPQQLRIVLGEAPQFYISYINNFYLFIYKNIFNFLGTRARTLKKDLPRIAIEMSRNDSIARIGSLAKSERRYIYKKKLQMFALLAN